MARDVFLLLLSTWLFPSSLLLVRGLRKSLLGNLPPEAVCVCISLSLFSPLMAS